MHVRFLHRPKPVSVDSAAISMEIATHLVPFVQGAWDLAVGPALDDLRRRRADQAAQDYRRQLQSIDTSFETVTRGIGTLATTIGAQRYTQLRLAFSQIQTNSQTVTRSFELALHRMSELQQREERNQRRTCCRRRARSVAELYQPMYHAMATAQSPLNLMGDMVMALLADETLYKSWEHGRPVQEAQQIVDQLQHALLQVQGFVADFRDVNDTGTQSVATDLHTWLEGKLIQLTQSSLVTQIKDCILQGFEEEAASLSEAIKTGWVEEFVDNRNTLFIRKLKAKWNCGVGTYGRETRPLRICEGWTVLALRLSDDAQARLRTFYSRRGEYLRAGTFPDEALPKVRCRREGFSMNQLLSSAEELPENSLRLTSSDLGIQYPAPPDPSSMEGLLAAFADGFGSFP